MAEASTSTAVAIRGPDGRFLPGGPSPNPKGRSLEAYRLADLAKAHTPAAIATLVEIMGDSKQPGQTRVNAATALLDRAFGRPSVSADVTVSANDAGQLHLDALRALAAMGRDGAEA